MAKKRKMRTVSLLGKDGGKIKKISDISIIIPSDNTPRIQEAHIMLIHIICEEVEKKFK
jgi:D-sedoheptulose 7-phosphate isomerase